MNGSVVPDSCACRTISSPDAGAPVTGLAGWIAGLPNSSARSTVATAEPGALDAGTVADRHGAAGQGTTATCECAASGTPGVNVTLATRGASVWPSTSTVWNCTVSAMVSTNGWREV